jgi:hypothetical protein
MSGRAELLSEVRRALAAGEVSRSDLAESPHEGHRGPAGRISATRVLLALGAVVIVPGIALIHTTAFLEMSDVIAIGSALVAVALIAARVGRRRQRRAASHSIHHEGT